MNSRVETEVSKFDAVKLTAALIVLVAGIVGFYVYAEHPALLRFTGLLLSAVIALAIAARTDKGRQLVGFFRESHIEVRKVVWPTRQETVQTTLIVLLMVIVVALILWLLDLLLGWGVGKLLGHGG